MVSNSQALQDIFAFQIAGKNGTYIEIGAHKPIKNSNTYGLEVKHQWKGFGIELDTKYQKGWDKCPERKNRVYWDDAINFNYVGAVNENHLTTHINYLSCDIEPPENTFKALQAVINQGITFDCITFEHDLYQSKENFDIIATEFLVSKGYKVAVTDVYCRYKDRKFETWFVNGNIDFPTITFDEWKYKNKL